MAYLAEHPLEGLTPPKREAIIDRAARQLNGLTFEQRQELKEGGTIRTFFTQLTSEERRRFLALTVPDGFRQLISTLNKMDPLERNRLVQRTLRNVRTHSAEAATIGDEEGIPKMISDGLSLFDEEANPEVKRAFAPVIEEVQRRKMLSDSRADSDPAIGAIK